MNPVLLMVSLATMPPTSDQPEPKGMKYIDGGTFYRGADGHFPDESPRHKVTVSSFYMDSTEVTQEEYFRVMGNDSITFHRKNIPITSVTHRDAILYCNARSRSEGLTPAYNEQGSTCNFHVKGYRLPTEAEWEYACRGGSAGDRPYSLSSIAWHNSARPQRVAQKKPNRIGLYDMLGNVAEFCNDVYGPYPSRDVIDPQGPTPEYIGYFYVVRGGSWASEAYQLCASYRGGSIPANRHDSRFGFRCVLPKLDTSVNIHD